MLSELPFYFVLTKPRSLDSSFQICSGCHHEHCLLFSGKNHLLTLQELGNGIADVLFGVESPAGRLVQTWSASIDDLLPILDYDITHGKTYMYDKTKPLFAIGHGLSYTKFEYSDLKLNKPSLGNSETVDVTVTVKKNSGTVNSDEVVQLYVASPDSKITMPIKP
jgi:beta-glucosidase